MATPKTRPTEQDVTAFLDAVEPPRRREEGHVLRALMERVTQRPAVMWGPTMVGFGSSAHTNTLGTHDWFEVGFSPRRPALTIYGVHNGSEPVNPLPAELGPHTVGKSCLYVKRLDDIDLEILERLIRDAWKAVNAG